ncbi:MAG: putative nucleic acid-binding protein contains PIN [Geobacteraceae bacterium]|nr:MAG: putative nucleic acid-binding protein contains PIN [Geobacteraceae bacterium]
MQHVAVVPEPPPAKIAWAAGLPLPTKDAPIMAAASACGADILVTGDRRDFGHLLGKTDEGTTVMTPRDTVRLLLEGKV